MPRVNVQFDGVSRGATKAAGETKAAIHSVGQAAKAEEKHVSRLGASFRTALGVGAKAAAGGLGVLGGVIAFTGFKFNDLKQRAEIAFTTMLGSGQKAQAFLDKLAAFAAKTPFEFPELIQTSQRLLAMGFAAEDIVPTMTSIGDAVAALGGGAEKLDRVTTALGQIQAKGKASAEEMLQLTEAGIPAWQFLADKIGKSVPEAMELVTKGAIDAELTIAAVTEGMTRKFGGMMEAQSHTFSGLLSTLKDTFRQVSGTAMEPFFDLATKGMQRLVDFTSGPGFTKGIERFGDILTNTVGPAVRKGVAVAMDAFRAIVPTVRDVARDVLRYWMAIFPLVRDAFVQVVRAIWPLLKSIIELFRDVVRAIAKVMEDHRVELERIISRVAAALGLIARVLNAVVIPVLRFLFTKLLPVLLGAAITAIDKFSAAIEGIAKFVRGLGSVFSNFFNWLVKTALEVALKMVEPFSHLPGGMGGWARKAKTRILAELAQIEAGAAAAGKSAGDAYGSNFAAASTAWISAVTVAGADAGRNVAGGGLTGGALSGALSGVKPGIISFGQQISAMAGEPLQVSSGLRPGSKTPSGSVSMHASGDALDIPATGARLTRLGQLALIAAGMPAAQARKITSYSGNINGYEILFNVAGHFDHLHVATEPAQTAPMPKPGGVTGITPATVDVDDPADKDDPADPAVVRQSRFQIRRIRKNLEAIVSPELRAKLRRRADDISKALTHVVNEEDLAKIRERLAKLTEDYENAVKLSSATKIARASAKRIAEQLERMPDEVRARLKPKMAKLQEELGNVTSQRQLERIKRQLQQIQNAVRAAIEKMQELVERRRDAFGRAWGRVADKALQIFDAKTAQLIRLAEEKARQLTASERALSARQLARDAELAGRQRSELAKRIAELSSPLVRETDETDEDYLARERQRLEDLADAQRAAADFEFDQETVRLERLAQQEREAADKQLDEERRRIEDERGLLRERFQMRLEEIERGLAEGRLTEEEAHAALMELMAEQGIDYAAAGFLVGDAFATGFIEALAELIGALDALRDSLGELWNMTGKGPPSHPGNLLDKWRGRYPPRGPSGGWIPIGTQHGGRIPGRYVGAEDTVLVRATPGEYVLDRELTKRLEAALAGGGLGGAIHLHVDTFVGDPVWVERWAAKLKTPLERVAGYKSER